MKKKFLSLIVAVAMLFSIVTFVVQADNEDETYFYLFAESTTSDMVISPIKISKNGFYDHNGQFVKFDSELDIAVDIVNEIFSYYKNEGETINEVEGILEDYDSYQVITISGVTYNYPNVRYSDGSGDGLQAYSFSGSTQHQLYDGEVIRFVVDDGDFSSYSYSSPVKDELINAVGDYYETLATDPKTAKKAESAYQAALENFFDENMQTELEDNLINALVPS